MAAELDKATVAKAYARWAPVYDLVFGSVFDRGRKASIAAAERIGGRILEVGVGTGLSLPDYAWTNRLIGVDFSAPMLRKAQGARRRAPAHQCRRARRDGRAASRLSRTAPSTWSWRNTSSPRCRTRRRRSTSSSACSGPAARSSWSTISAPRPGLRARLRALLRAAGAPARLAAGIPLGAPGAMGRAPRRRAASSSAAPMPPLGHFSLIRFGRLGGDFAPAGAAE